MLIFLDMPSNSERRNSKALLLIRSARKNGMMHLDLSNRQLITLPIEIGQLPRLQTLDLSGNNLTMLPETIGRLFKLRMLNASGNQLKALLEEIGQLFNLETLDISANQLETLPEGLGQLPSLRALDVSGNPLRILPRPIRQLIHDQIKTAILPDETRQLEDYVRLSALFQFYLQLILQAFTFALGVAGGVSAFVLGWDVHNRRQVAWSLLLPAALCLGMGFSFIFSVRSSRNLNDALQTLKCSLRRKLAPHATNLSHSLLWLGMLLVVCGFVIILLIADVVSGHYRLKKQSPLKSVSISSTPGLTSHK
jgi:Leucine-rich repeat (LRR) protein